ncbi:MAG TPA: hypothetical protein VFC41_04515 [Anaerovoracaceae bacterium]|nr:hypothetical protein [Anaerovoracaceae bacterium]
MTQITTSIAEKVVLDISKEINDYHFDIINWRNLNEHQLWVELVACIIGSQVSHEHAKSVLTHINSLGLLDAQIIIKESSNREMMISEELSKPVYAPIRKNGLGRKFRYPNVRAKQICHTAISIYSKNSSLFRLLNESRNDFEARNRIMNACAGIGPKQSSMFLRNIGYSSNLAIIDSHVLKFMYKKGLTINNNGYIRQHSEYFNLENNFLQYAKEVGINPGDLDMAIWTVMRMVDVGDY